MPFKKYGKIFSTIWIYVFFSVTEMDTGFNNLFCFLGTLNWYLLYGSF